MPHCVSARPAKRVSKRKIVTLGRRMFGAESTGGLSVALLSLSEEGDRALGRRVHMKLGIIPGVAE